MTSECFLLADDLTSTAIPPQVLPSATPLLVPPALLAEGSVHCERTRQLLRQAQAHKLLPTLKLLDARWLLDSISHWRRLPEEDYVLPLECLALSGPLPLPTSATRVVAHPSKTSP